MDSTTRHPHPVPIRTLVCEHHPGSFTDVHQISDADPGRCLCGGVIVELVDGHADHDSELGRLLCPDCPSPLTGPTRRRPRRRRPARCARCEFVGVDVPAVVEHVEEAHPDPA